MIKKSAEYLNLQSLRNMEKSIKSIEFNHDKTFAFSDIALNFTEKNILDNIKILLPIQFNYYGLLNFDKLPQMISEYITELDRSNNAQMITDILLDRIIKPYIYLLDHNAFWLTIRAWSHPSNSFDIPRWHNDGYYYKGQEFTKNNKYQLKLAGVFKGNPTMFKRDNALVKSIAHDMNMKFYETYDYRNPNNKSQELDHKINLDNSLKQYPTVIPSKYQIAIFSVGQKGKSAIHSEPKIDNLRFFFSIVSGTGNEIRDLAISHNDVFHDKL